MYSKKNKTASFLSTRSKKIKQPNWGALFFIQADEGGLVCNQRARALYVIATESRMASRASVYKFVGLITYIPSE